MKINDHRQALLSNNMANVDTVGFKHDLAVVRQRPVESRSNPAGAGFSHPVLDGLSGGVHVQPVFHSFTQGPLKITGQPLDIAIMDEGFFAVSDGEETRYTRDGKMALNSAGDLTLAAGSGRWKVLDQDGAPINVDQSAGAVALADDGTVRQNRQILARIGTFSTDNLQSLRKVGENTFRALEAMQPVDSQFSSGSVEGSSFNIMEGLASMIEAQRAYQMNANLIRIQDEMTGRAISSVGQVA
jgi:flagellar basal body rod protein FlgG